MLPELDESLARERIARRIAMDLEDGSVVNLGIGIPTLVSDYIPDGYHILIHTENGVLGAGPKPEKDDWKIIGAGGRCLTIIPSGVFIASDMSFGIIRGGHLDATVLGALEVDQEANLANWWVPGKMIPGMGGAMDLVCGAKKVYVASSHLDKKGRPKLIAKCSLPLTAVNVVSVIVTEFCLIRRINGKMVLCEIAPEVTLEELLAHTGMELTVAEDLCVMKGGVAANG